MELIGRSREIKQLHEKLVSKEAELILVYGRRRVGKTALVRHVAQGSGQVFLEITGVKGLGSREQIINAFNILKIKFPAADMSKAPLSWKGFFKIATDCFQRSSDGVVFFLDEFPWLCTPKSRFLHFFDYYWNTTWSKLPNLKIVVCGSATSWLLEKFLGDKGGLHNRLTTKLNLQPFDLAGAAAFLKHHGLILTNRQLIELYLCFGGIPYYLSWAEKGETPSVGINNLLNQRHSLLVTEYEILLQALFREVRDHQKILTHLSSKRYGVMRSDLSRAVKLSEGSHFQNLLKELVACGFIFKYIPFGLSERNSYFRLIDEYVLFYKKWIAPRLNQNIAGKEDFWLSVRNTPEYYSWAGYGFETICQKEANSILRAMGISGMQVEISNFKDKASGAQIDLVLDRGDEQINLVEIKYSKSPVRLDSRFIKELMFKEQAFQNATKTKRPINWILISAAGTIGSVTDFFRKIINIDDLIF